MSAMPPKPRFRSRSLRLASSRSRMPAISSSISGCHGDAVGRSRDGGHDLAAEVRIAVDHAGPRQRLPLPELGPAALVVAAELRQRDHQAARLAGRPQPHVHLVEPAHRPQHARRP